MELEWEEEKPKPKPISTPNTHAARTYKRKNLFISVKTKLHHWQSNQKWANSHLKRPFWYFLRCCYLTILHRPNYDIYCIRGVGDGSGGDGGGGGGGNNAIQFVDWTSKHFQAHAYKMVKPCWLAHVVVLFAPTNEPRKCAAPNKQCLHRLGIHTINTILCIFYLIHAGNAWFMQREKPIHRHGASSFLSLYLYLYLYLTHSHTRTSNVFVLFDRRRMRFPTIFTFHRTIVQYLEPLARPFSNHI